MDGPSFSARDLEQLRAAGISEEEARRQLRLLADPPPPARLTRPARPGDGIRVLDPAHQAELETRGRRAAARSRLLKFVPASGAASRMFRAPAAVLRDRSGETIASLRSRAADDADARQVLLLTERFDALPFAADWLDSAGLDRAPADDTPIGPFLEALLRPSGLGFADRPKGLIPFHRDASGRRTAFEEHLVEGARIARDADGLARFHFTVSARHQDQFEDLLERSRGWIADAFGCRLEVSFWGQRPAADTLALDASGEPFRKEDGSLLLRPGGHGALLRNLAATGGDLVFVKNIDNVLPDRLKPDALRWKRILAGCLDRLQQNAFAHLEALEAPDAERDGTLAEARSFVTEELGLAWRVSDDSDAERRALIACLDRPFRVCGMVRNTGEPGGGPFWVRSRDGVERPQIVETAQIDRDDADQRRILDAASHFNPVDLVCGLRDRHGRPYPLDRFVDPDAAFVAAKSVGGRALRALEHPGLWNGAMAGWNTVFVDVPGATFAPVKTVVDLLRPEHQG